MANTEAQVVKHIQAGKFLMDSGLLFEINRTLLHPLGLALEVVINDDGTVALGDLRDYRDDPEGIIYGEGAFLHGRAKYQATMETWGNGKLKLRKERLGYVLQDE